MMLSSDALFTFGIAAMFLIGGIVIGVRIESRAHDCNGSFTFTPTGAPVFTMPDPKKKPRA
jgi:hypothetical protein